MNVHVLQRPYTSEADLDALLALKQRCATPQTMYDSPTVSDLRQLLLPLAIQNAHTQNEQTWWQALEALSPAQRQRALTQHLTALWEDAGGNLLAYALIAQPGSSLTLQVHPQARGQGIETAILTWGLAQMQFMVQRRGTPRDLWCRCHTSEQARQHILEAAGFQPLFGPDLRLVHALSAPLPPVSFPSGFALQSGIMPEETDAYQQLHQAIFDGVSIYMDEHLSNSYQRELDLIAVEENGRFAAFCLCKLQQVADSPDERLVGEVGLIGTRPDLQRRGLGRALLLTGLSRLYAHGATCAYLETGATHGPAWSLFTSVGFTHLSTWQWYARTVEPI